ncbi:MAG: hypothetical protein ACQEVT_11265 [Pseudomonadota bacterium]|uniref:hypothetical protein n=1 Tax=Roseovarius TaxID=74030 RepID=UPI0022A81922|nr:hypothetical protein [Roseovarius sp. EGI FJ00037]MCZ0812408.1 hypothetical protein [Roseovarius sp. EGI FJ00037]
MTRSLSAIPALCMAAPAFAADPANRYTAMGTMTVQLGDKAFDMVIPFDTEKQRGYAEQTMIMGTFLTINAVGQVPEPDGMPGSPMLQITLQRRTGDMAFLSAEVFDDQGFDAPMVMGADGGDRTLAAFSMEGNIASGVIAGEFLRLTGYSSDPKVAEGATPVTARIEWKVELPPLE